MSSRPAPDLAGFKEALDAKAQLVGSDVVFLGPPVATWPPGTRINQFSGDPYDPTITPVGVTQSRDVVRAGVFFKAVNRGGAANAAIGSPAGWEDRSRIFAITPIAAKAIVERAVAFEFHGETFKIDVVKEDEVIGGYQRMLVYAGSESE